MTVGPVPLGAEAGIAGLFDRGETDQRLLEFQAVVDQLRAGRTDSRSGQAAEAESGADPAAVPVTVIAGPLGSGKTTVVRSLLTGDHGLRLAVVVNDLAEVGIDADLLADVAPDRVELSNGCSCCTLAGEVVDALASLAGSAAVPDGIVVETSGVTDAVALCHAVLAAPGCRLDGVATVVDAVRLGAFLGDGHDRLGELSPLVRRQLDAATVVLLSKTDLVDTEAARELRRRLAEAVPGRPILDTLHGSVEPSVLLDGARHGAALGVGAATSGSAKTGPAICARTVEVSTVAEGALAEWLSRAARPLLLRAKGLVALEDGSTRLLQLVGNRWSLDTCELSARTTTGRLALLALDEATLDAVAADLSALGVQRQS